jgi:hypothetical protein
MAALPLQIAYLDQGYEKFDGTWDEYVVCCPVCC